MATSVFFQNYQYTQEQELLNSLIIESIRIHGIDCWYVPRKLNNYDSIYGADDQSSYETAILMEMYIESYDGFKGDGNFMSKFGIEIRDQVTFAFAMRVFEDEVGVITAQPRPNEGDLIYYPLNGKCFQIKYVDKFEMHYPLGKLYLWKVTCELFEYSNERISTGIPEIDALQSTFDLNAIDWVIRDELGNILLNEDSDYIVLENSTTSDLIIGDDSDEIQQESDLFVDFTVSDPFSLGNI